MAWTITTIRWPIAGNPPKTPAATPVATLRQFESRGWTLAVDTSEKLQLLSSATCFVRFGKTGLFHKVPAKNTLRIAWCIVALQKHNEVVLARKTPSISDWLLGDELTDEAQRESFEAYFSDGPTQRSLSNQYSALSEGKNIYLAAIPIVAEGSTLSTETKTLDFKISLQIAQKDHDNLGSLFKLWAQDKTLEDLQPGYTFSAFHLYEPVLHQTLQWKEEQARPKGLAEVTGSFQHQRRALSWLLQREDGAIGVHSHVDACKEEYELMWIKLVDNLYYSPWLGRIECRAHKMPSLEFSEPRGGILADEMGLGKTVEVISLILSRPYPAADLKNAATKKATSVRTSPTLPNDATLSCFCPTLIIEGAPQDQRIKRSQFVHCKFCDTWQHAFCVAFDPNNMNDVEHYACPMCGANPASETAREAQGSVKKSNSSIRDLHAASSSAPPGLKSHSSSNGVNSLLPDKKSNGEQNKRTLVRTALDVKTTLIICPDSILPQWVSELGRHTAPGALKYGVLTGKTPLELSSPKTPVFVRAEQFLEYDVIVTSYQVLTDALGRGEAAIHQRNTTRRSGPRFHAMPSPLTGVAWYRVCFDESQMIGDGANKAAQLTWQMRIRHRWAVSGTPISKNVNDLLGLMIFLDVKPYNDRTFWRKVIAEPVMAGHLNARSIVQSILKRIMWRTEKQYAEGLGMPGLTQFVHEVHFSELESYMYRKRQKSYEDRLIEARRRQDIGKLREADVIQMVNDLKMLRQACSHHQLGQTFLQKVSEGVMSAPAVVTQLISQASSSAQEKQNARVKFLKGLAALALAQGRILDAENIYRQVLERAANGIDSDADSRHHAQFNLIETLETLIAQGNAGNEKKREIATLKLQVDSYKKDHVSAYKLRYLAIAESYLDGLASFQVPVEQDASDVFVESNVKAWVPAPVIEDDEDTSDEEDDDDEYFEDMDEDDYAGAGKRKNAKKRKPVAILPMDSDDEYPVEDEADDAPKKKKKRKGKATAADMQVDNEDFNLEAAPEPSSKSKKSKSKSKEKPTSVKASSPKVIDLDTSEEEHKAGSNEKASVHGQDQDGTRDAPVQVDDDSLDRALRKERKAIVAENVEETRLRSRRRQSQATSSQIAADDDSGVNDAPSYERNGTQRPSQKVESKVIDLSSEEAEEVKPRLANLEDGSMDVSEEEDAEQSELEEQSESESSDEEEEEEPAEVQQERIAQLFQTDTPALQRIDPEFWIERDDAWWKVAFGLLSEKQKIAFHQRAIADFSRSLRPELLFSFTTITNFIKESFADLSRTLQLVKKSIKTLLDSNLKPIFLDPKSIEDVTKGPLAALHLGDLVKDVNAEPNWKEYMRREGCPECQSRRLSADKRGHGNKHLMLSKEEQADLLCVWCAAESHIRRLEELLVNHRHTAYLNLLNLLVEFMTSKKVALRRPFRGEMVKTLFFANRAFLRGLQLLRELRSSAHRLIDGHLAYAKRLDEIGVVESRWRLMSSAAKNIGPHYARTLIADKDALATKEELTVGLKNANAELQEALSQVTYLEKTKMENFGATQCVVCWEPLPDKCMLLPCGHSGCPDCFKKTLDVSKKCPICRAPVKENERVIASRSSSALGLPDKPPAADKKVSHWGSKIDAIVHLIQAEIAKHPNDKFLLFSHWTEVLGLVSKALTEARISVLLATGQFAAKLKEFSERSTATVLCLQLEKGSKGANLTVASQIIFVEPTLMVASEAQAIGRIHRMGQTKHMKVHRFFVTESVEHSIFELSKLRQQQTAQESSVGFGTADKEASLLSLDTIEKLLKGKPMVPSDFMDVDPQDLHQEQENGAEPHLQTGAALEEA